MLPKVPIHNNMNVDDFTIGHRGCRNVPWPELKKQKTSNLSNQVIPELSHEALQYGINQGYHAIEIDVWLTKDDKIVANHDETLLDSFGVNKKIFDCTLNELQSFPFTKNQNRELPNGYINHILTLKHILDNFIATNNNVFLFLEIKDTNNPYKLVNQILALLDKYNECVWSRIICISFMPTVLYKIKKLSNYKLQIGLLADEKLFEYRSQTKCVNVHWLIDYTYWLIDPILFNTCKYIAIYLLGASIIGLDYDWLFSENGLQYIKYCKKNNVKIFVWGQNCDKKKCLENGVWCETDS